MIKRNLLGILSATLICGTTAFADTTETTVYHGIGQNSNVWVFPASEKGAKQFYIINVVEAAVIFDAEGKILNVYSDTLEFSSPNRGSVSMPHFQGWPGIEAYPYLNHETGKLEEVEITNELISKQVAEWKTKRERGDAYAMNPNNEWYEQVNFYQTHFVGKTVAELEEEFKTVYSDINGKPLQADAYNDRDKEKYSKLTDEQKALAADITAGATMSIRDSHGDILGAIAEAYENRVPVMIPVPNN